MTGRPFHGVRRGPVAASGRARYSIALGCCATIALAGCDKLFGLDHVGVTDAAVIDVSIDAALPPCERGYPSVPLVDVPVGAYRATSGDFNQDGKQDLAVGSTLTDAVEILLGNGDGTFATARSYAARNAPFAIVSGDLDGDGDLDLVVANDAGTAAGGVSVLLGNGDGTFALPTNNNGVGVNPRGLALGDFDGDGKLDIAVVNYGSGTAGVLLGNGNGTFSAQVPHTAGTNPYGIVIADFNEDGRLDIATANVTEGNVGVLINTSTGPGSNAFAAPTKLATGAGAIELATADLDGNGHADLAVANSGAKTASVLLGNGNGSFGAAASYPAGTSPRSVAILDVDHDTLPDVLIGNVGQVGSAVTVDGDLSLLLGTGNGVLGATTSLPTITAPIALVPVDLDNDAQTDVAVLSRDNGFVHVLLDHGGTLSAAMRLASSGLPVRGAVADLDGDDRSDLAMTADSSNRIDVFLSARGVLTAHATYSTGTQPYAVALGDLDGDAIPDLIVGNYTNGMAGTVWVHRGLGSGVFDTAVTSYGVGASPTTIAVSDLDLDGDQDLVVTDYIDNAIQILRNNGTTLTKEAEIAMSSTYPLEVKAYDFDKDGRPDLVATGQTSNNITVRLATGPTSYGPVLPHTSIDLNPISFAIADLDRNGKADVALADHNSGTIGVLSGTGDGTFATVGTFPTTANPWGMALADLDGDGMLDAVTTSDSRDVVTIVHGMGDGRFGEMHSYPVGLGPTAVLLGDFDGDGYPDLAVSNRGGSSITVLQARCLK